jgi:hypothetical protein
VDVREGTYKGVGIGSTRVQAQRQLGRATTKSTDPLRPRGADDPIGIPWAPQQPRESCGSAIWRFEEAAMAAGCGRAWLVAIAAEDAVTEEGVGVGSSLADVRSAYPRAECYVENEGTEYTSYPLCVLRVARERYLAFGYDPVRGVTMSRGRFD